MKLLLYAALSLANTRHLCWSGRFAIAYLREIRAPSAIPSDHLHFAAAPARRDNHSRSVEAAGRDGVLCHLGPKSIGGDFMRFVRIIPAALDL